MADLEVLKVSWSRRSCVGHNFCYSTAVSSDLPPTRRLFRCLVCLHVAFNTSVCGYPSKTNFEATIACFIQGQEDGLQDILF